MAEGAENHGISWAGPNRCLEHRRRPHAALPFRSHRLVILPAAERTGDPPAEPARTQVLGLARSVGWLEMYVGLDWALERGQRLAHRLRTALSEADGVELIGNVGEFFREPGHVLGECLHDLVCVAAAQPAPGDRFQFERHGYFVLDARRGDAGQRVFNRAAGMRDSWGK